MDQITLHSFYQNTEGVRIQAGVYDANDARLHKLGEYLVLNGHATLIKGEPTPEVSKEEALQDFNSMTVAQLKDYARDNDIDISGVTRKDEIIERIQE